MMPIRSVAQEILLWILRPTRAPWTGKGEQTHAVEAATVVGSAGLLAGAYATVRARQQLFFGPLDADLVFLLDTIIIPIALSVALRLFRRTSDWSAVPQTLSWLYRAWTLQLFLVWFWALALKQYGIVSVADCPMVTDFSVVVAITAVIVSGLAAASMRGGQESWQNVCSALAIYCLATLASRMLNIPVVSRLPWWAPDVGG